jgi:glycerol-3-phosphate dehydrogenase
MNKSYDAVIVGGGVNGVQLPFSWQNEDLRLQLLKKIN